MRYKLNAILVAFAVAAVLIAFNGPKLQFASNVSASEIPAGITTIDNAGLKKIIETPGKTQMVLFYASWCPYCNKQMQALAQFQPKHPDIEITAISIDRKPAQLAEYLKKSGKTNFPHYLFHGDDDLAAFLYGYGIEFSGAIPYTALFKDGVLKANIRGYNSAEALSAIVSE